MAIVTRLGAGVVVTLAALGAACGAPGGGAPPGDETVAPVPHRDTTGLGLVPAGYGTLRQEDVALQIRLPQLVVRALPLDESVIRLLSPDSYRALRALRDGNAAATRAIAARQGVEQPSVWYVSYFGLQPDAHFSANDVAIMAAARKYRPIGIVPLTSGFSGERVSQGSVASALYVFDAGIDPWQPLSLTVESTPSTDWGTVLPVLEHERALVRSRAGTP